jgi:aquaporin Z
MRKYMAEAIGTFAVVFSGCGAVALGGAKLGEMGVAIAFGLALSAMTLAIAPVSGAHFNPAVSVAMVLAGRLRLRELAPYLAVQIAGGTAATALVIRMANDRPGGNPLAAELLASGYGSHSPGFYGLSTALIAEVTLTALFVFVLLGASAGRLDDSAVHAGALSPPSSRSPNYVPWASAFAALAAGLSYSLIQIVGMPVTKMPANPARAIGPALLAGGWAFEQLWVFVLAPVVGGILAALAHRYLRGLPFEKSQLSADAASSGK